MNQTDPIDEILKNIGGKSENDLNEILNDFIDTDFEINTFGDLPHKGIDSQPEHFMPTRWTF